MSKTLAESVTAATSKHPHLPTGPDNPYDLNTMAEYFDQRQPWWVTMISCLVRTFLFHCSEAVKQRHRNAFIPFSAGPRGQLAHQTPNKHASPYS